MHTTNDMALVSLSTHEPVSQSAKIAVFDVLVCDGSIHQSTKAITRSELVDHGSTAGMRQLW